ncbi:MAG: helix-turn-helix transcriptional regulator [Acetobacteraceae bacterium]|nr:helix-turn-helix transcriptional regulator [Acetobacteraceae bacterium]
MTRGRLRPASELVEDIERDDPAGAAAEGLSSASMRAGDLIRSMRREAGLTQAQLARHLGVEQSRVSELEAGRGVHGPSWSLMERIASACGRRIGTLEAAAEAEARPIADRYAAVRNAVSRAEGVEYRRLLGDFPNRVAGVAGHGTGAALAQGTVQTGEAAQLIVEAVQFVEGLVEVRLHLGPDDPAAAPRILLQPVAAAGSPRDLEALSAMVPGLVVEE